MSFQYSAIGDNTPENREHLEKLGYKPNYMYDKEGVLYTRNDISNYYVGFIENIKHECVNCIGNDPLFQAVSAMRDDNHIHQWHIIDYDVYLDIPKDYWFIATDLSGGKYVGCQIDPMYCHKATLSELQAHFKRV